MKKKIIYLCLTIGLALATFPQVPLAQTLSEKPEVFVQLGHTGTVYSAFFSPDGKYAFSNGSDKTAKLWDVATGREIRTFQGVDSISAVSPDGRYALSTSYLEDTIKLWEISTGKEIKILKMASTRWRVIFSPDCKYALSKHTREPWILWDITSGKEIKTFQDDYFISDDGYGDPMSFSPDGKYIMDSQMRLWEVSTGKVTKKFSHRSPFQYRAKAVVFSPDGKYALSSTKEEETPISLWDIASGKEIKTFKIYSDFLAFTPDSKHFLLGLVLWDVVTGEQVRKLQGTISAPVNFSPDGKYILSAFQSDIKLWDVATGNEIRTFQRHPSRDTDSAVFSPDNQYILFAETLWDRVLGKEIKRCKGESFSPDGKYTLYIDIIDDAKKTRIISLWNISENKKFKAFESLSAWYHNIIFSPDGKYLLSHGVWGRVDMGLWEIATGKEIMEFKGHTSAPSNYYADWIGISSSAFSPDGKYIISGGGWDKTVRLWEVSSGKEIKTFQGHSYWIDSVAFSPDGKYIVSGSRDDTIKLWDVATGNEIRTLKGHSNDVKSVTFSPDGKYILSGSDDLTLKLWEVTTGNEVRTFKGHTNSVTRVTFSSDGKYALSGSYDHTTRLWDINTGKEICQMVSFEDGEWICITPEGYYNSSVNGDKYLNVRVGNNAYGIDQYRSVFYKPEIVEAALRFGDSNKAITEVTGTGPKATIATLQGTEPPVITINSPKNGTKINSADTELSIHIEDKNNPIKSVDVYANGRIVASEGKRGIAVIPKATKSEDNKTRDIKIPVKLDDGENLIEVTASNGFSESRETIRIYSEKTMAQSTDVILPNLWILSIGINKYDDKRINSLTYAAADAEGFVKAFESQKGKLFRDIKSLIITDNSSVKPTCENIIDNIDYLSKAGSNDIVILFIAGHGMNDDKGEYYFLPCDTVITDDGTIKKSKAISWMTIKNVLDIPAKKLIFVDTCHSEGVSGKKTRAVDNNRLVKELQEANAVIFTSSRGKELSQESNEWKHGAFTYAIIEGLSGKADLIKDGKISMKELDAYVSETVPQITNGAQHPITITPDGYLNFPVALIK